MHEPVRLKPADSPVERSPLTNPVPLAFEHAERLRALRRLLLDEHDLLAAATLDPFEVLGKVKARNAEAVDEIRALLAGFEAYRIAERRWSSASADTGV